MSGAVPVLQMVLSLAAVVAMILGLAWMTRRMQGLRAAQHPDLRVRASLAVGMKERVVILEAGGQQFLIGVAPGQVNLLQTLGPSVSAEPALIGVDASAAGAETPPSLRESFAIQLNKLLAR